MTKLTPVIAVMALVLSSVSVKADSSIFAQDLSRCMIKSVSQNDKELMARWIFVTMASNPNTKDLANISEIKKEETNRYMAKLITRLITESCAAESKQVLTYDNDAGLSNSFEILGKVAMGELLANPATSAASQEFAKYLDTKDFEALGLGSEAQK